MKNLPTKSKILKSFSLDRLLQSLNSVLDNIGKNISSSGNVFVKYCLICLLLMLVSLQNILLVIKKLNQWILRLKDFVLWVLSVSFEEANFYWKKAHQQSKAIIASLDDILQRLKNHTDYLSKLASESSDDSQANKQTGNATMVLKTLADTVWLVVLLTTAIFVTFAFLVTSILGVPVIHKWARTKWFK